MFPSGQWSFNPLAYQNVPSDRVDWASLAQQWIKMKETMPNLNQEPTPPPAPQISKPKNSRPESAPELPPNDIEGGEAPMDMDTKDDDIPESVGAGSNWNQWNNWPNQWGWGWSGNAGTVPSGDNASSTSSSVDSKVKWSENLLPSESTKSTSETWSKVNRPRQSQKPVTIEQSPIIDAVKKKQLPAWIREGLSKMEREKQKKLERERLMQERLLREQEPFREDSPVENLPIVANTPTYVRDNPSQNVATMPGIVHSFEPIATVVPDPPCLRSPPRNKEENTSLIRKTKDEIMEESMLKIRRILTEILLKATENHVVTIAREELKRAKSSARAIRRSNAVSALSGNLGLNIYGSGSDDSDSSSSENTHLDRKSDSDEELKLLIDRKKQDFKRIEDEIDIEIEMQEAKEKSIVLQDEDVDDDDDDNDDNDHDDEDSHVDVSKIDNGSASRLQEIPRQDVRYKSSSCKVEEDSITSLHKTKEPRVPNQELSGSRNNSNRSSGQLNGDRKNGKVELKPTRSPSSTSSSDSKSESYSSTSSKSKSSYSSRSGSDSDASSHRKRSKHSENTNKRSKKSINPKRYRSRSRSPSRGRRTADFRIYSSRSHKRESLGRRSSPYRQRSRSRRRSSSRSREKYSESSRRYDSHSKSRRRRSTSSDSRRSRYKRR